MNFDFLQSLRILRNVNVFDFRRFLAAALDDDIIFLQQGDVFFGEGDKQFEFAASPIAARPNKRRNLFDDPLKRHFPIVYVRFHHYTPKYRLL